MLSPHQYNNHNGDGELYSNYDDDYNNDSLLSSLLSSFCYVVDCFKIQKQHNRQHQEERKQQCTTTIMIPRRRQRQKHIQTTKRIKKITYQQIQQNKRRHYMNDYLQQQQQQQQQHSSLLSSSFRLLLYVMVVSFLYITMDSSGAVLALQSSTISTTSTKLNHFKSLSLSSSLCTSNHSSSRCSSRIIQHNLPPLSCTKRHRCMVQGSYFKKSKQQQQLSSSYHNSLFFMTQKKRMNHHHPNNNNDSTVQPPSRADVSLKESIIGSSSSSTTNDDISSTTNTLSIPSYIVLTFNLIKSMLGTGILALPGAVAMITNEKRGLVPATILLCSMGLLSSYTFILYGRLIHTTQAKTLGELWEMIYNPISPTYDQQQQSTKKTSTTSGSSSSSSSSKIISLASFSFTFGVCVAYSLIIGDILTSLVQQLFGSGSGIGIGGIGSIGTTILSLRQVCVLFVSSMILYPLCTIQSTTLLAPFSILGVLGSFFATCFVLWRCPLLNSNSPYTPTYIVQQLASTTNTAIVPTSLFQTYNRMTTGSPSPLVLVATGCVALIAHFSSCDFYHSIVSSMNNNKSKNKKNNETKITTATTTASSTMSNSIDNNNNNNRHNPMIMKYFRRITYSGFATVAFLNAITMIYGFLTFGGSSSSGIILNNYSNTDRFATVSKLFIAISVIGSYPIVMNACQAELNTLLKSKVTKTISSSSTTSTSTTSSKSNSQNENELKQRKNTNTLLLTLVTGIALLIKDAGFVISFIGSVMGCNIIYTFPCLLFLKRNRNNTSNNSSSSSSRIGGKNSSTMMMRIETIFCKFLIGIGIVSAIIGGITSILASFYPHLLSS